MSPTIKKSSEDTDMYAYFIYESILTFCHYYEYRGPTRYELQNERILTLVWGQQSSITTWGNYGHRFVFVVASRWGVSSYSKTTETFFLKRYRVNLLYAPKYSLPSTVKWFTVYPVIDILHSQTSALLVIFSWTLYTNASCLCCLYIQEVFNLSLYRHFRTLYMYTIDTLQEHLLV